MTEHTSCVLVVKPIRGGLVSLTRVEIRAAARRFSLCSFHLFNSQFAKSAIAGPEGKGAIEQDACS